jgi:hypothetical protein
MSLEVIWLDLQGVSEFWITSEFVTSISLYQKLFYVEVDSSDPEPETSNVTEEHDLII